MRLHEIIPGYRHLNVVGAVLMVTALVIIFVYKITSVVPLILLIASLIISIILVIQRKHLEEETRPDERTEKIGTKALSYAWWFGIVGVIILFWADVLGIWRPGTQTALGISFFLLFGSAVFFLMYLSKKGDRCE